MNQLVLSPCLQLHWKLLQSLQKLIQLQLLSSLKGNEDALVLKKTLDQVVLCPCTTPFYCLRRFRNLYWDPTHWDPTYWDPTHWYPTHWDPTKILKIYYSDTMNLIYQTNLLQNTIWISLIQRVLQ